MEMPVHPGRSGAASSWRDVGLAIFAAPGVDRAKSRVAGGEAVSVELAVVERRLLCDAAGRGSLGRDYGPRGSGQVSRSSREAARRARFVEGGLAGIGAHSAHAGETSRCGTHSKTIAARSSKAHHGASDFVEATHAPGCL